MLGITYSGVVLLGCGVLLSIFVYRRWRYYLLHKTSTINTLYLQATFFGCASFFVYAVPGFLFDPRVLFFCAIIGTALNMISNGYFLRIPLRAFISENKYALFSHLIALYVVGIIAVFVIYPPAPVLSDAGTLHWHFGLLKIVLTLGLNAVAFSGNIWFIFKSLQETPRWKSKFIAMICTFALTGAGADYVYAGDSEFLLNAAYFALFVGILFLTVGILVSLHEEEKALRPI